MYKSLETIALPITEEEYRQDGNMHYSTLATYERGGFNAIATLGERKESPSLTFGSAVDSLITGGREEFDERFLVAEYPPLEPANITITKAIFSLYRGMYQRIAMIPDSEIITITEQQSYHLNWKPETRAKVIKEKCEEYYSLLYIAETKTLLDSETYQDVLNAVRALKTSPATAWYFADNNTEEDGIERVYQPKFRATFDGVTYSCMMDLVIVDHINKIIYPCDLKTSSHYEYEFHKSFLDWNYDIQAREYAAILKANLAQDEYFKDFKVMDYRFIVVNRRTLDPRVWEWSYTFTDVTVELKTSRDYPVRMRNFREIGKELYTYLTTEAKVPNGITTEPNNIAEWIHRM